MKKFRTLIPAFCAMLISAVMLGTSTYAWFSVNTKVTATDMQVTAQANTQYFVISKTTTDFGTSVKEALGTTEISQGGIGSNDSTKTTVVAPAAYDQVSYQGDEDTTYYVGMKNKWWTANVNEYDATTNDKIINVQEIKAPSGEGKTVYDNNTYFVGYTFYVGLATNSTDYTGNLRVLVNNGTNGASVAAVKIEQQGEGTTKETVAITAGSPVSDKTYYQSTNEYTLSAGNSQKYVKVTVYIYLDGNNDYVRDANVTSLESTGDRAGIKVGGAAEEFTA